MATKAAASSGPKIIFGAGFLAEEFLNCVELCRRAAEAVWVFINENEWVHSLEVRPDDLHFYTGVSRMR